MIGRKRIRNVNGFLVANKPSGWTSHDVVSKIKKNFKLKKVGHAGTLDPNATGVLVLCIGAATRLVSYLNTDPKEYKGEMVLGIRTDTLDITGKVLAEEATKVTLEQAERAFGNLRGKIKQIPPMVSAVKVNGRPLYAHARQGKEIKREPREVEVYTFNILDMVSEERQIIKFKVVCSKGTYVRSLCEDVGEILGCGACLGSLIRTRSGDYSLSQALNMDEIIKLENNQLTKILVPLDMALNHYQEITIKNECKDRVLNGSFITGQMLSGNINNIDENEIIRLLDEKDNLLGLAKAKKEITKTVISKDEQVLARPVCIIPDLK